MSSILSADDELILSIIKIAGRAFRSITSSDDLYEFVRRSDTVSLNFSNVKTRFIPSKFERLIESAKNCTTLKVNLPKKKSYAQGYAEELERFPNTQILEIRYNPKDKMTEEEAFEEQFDNMLNVEDDDRRDLLSCVYHLPNLHTLEIHSGNYNFSNMIDLLGCEQLRTLTVRCPITSFVNILRIPHLDTLYLNLRTFENPVPFNARIESDKESYSRLLKNAQIENIVFEDILDVSEIANIGNITKLNRVSIIETYNEEYFQREIDAIRMKGKLVESNNDEIEYDTEYNEETGENDYITDDYDKPYEPYVYVENVRNEENMEDEDGNEEDMEDEEYEIGGRRGRNYNDNPIRKERRF
jgi:hypothetical protein